MLFISGTHLGDKIWGFFVVSCYTYIIYMTLIYVNVLLRGRTLFVHEGIFFLFQICSNLLMLLKQLDVSATFSELFELLYSCRILCLSLAP